MTAPGGNFIQLFSLLANLGQQRKAQDLEERKFTQTQDQFKTLVKQYEEQHGDKQFSEGLSMIGKMGPEMIAGFQKMVSSKVGQQHPELAESLMQMAANAPSMLGLSKMSPEQRAATYQEAGSQMASGMPTGGVGASQMQQALTTGGPPPGQVGQVVDQGSWNQLIRGAAERGAQGYTGQQFGFQQQQATQQQAMQQAQIELGWASLRQDERRMVAEMGLRDIAGKTPDQLSMAQRSDALRGIGQLLNDMNAAKADKEGNMARQRAIGMVSLLLGLPSNYFVPQPNPPERPPTPGSPFRSFVAPLVGPGVIGGGNQRP